MCTSALWRAKIPNCTDVHGRGRAPFVYTKFLARKAIVYEGLTHHK